LVKLKFFFLKKAQLNEFQGFREVLAIKMSTASCEYCPQLVNI